MFRIFLAFLVAAGLSSCQVNHSCLLAFMEYLYRNQFSPANIQNHMAGIRAQFILHNLDTTPFQHPQIQYFYKALKINRPLQPRSHTYIDVPLLSSLVALTQTFPLVYKSLLLVAYFSFLRLSNLFPHTVGSFDPTRQLARGDMLFSNQGATLLIKWSKTLQTRSDIRTIPLPWLRDSPLCPVTSLYTLLQTQSGTTNDPVFRISRSHGLVPLTNSVARKYLTSLSAMLHLAPKLTFHDFRRSGATWAFQHGVPLQQIMHHGTWKSDAIWSYIQNVPTASSSVSHTFQHYLLQ